MATKYKQSPIDFSKLMDLRIDYAFKLIFAKGDQLSVASLVSLLNAIFANKKINRVVKKVAIKNPFLEKESQADKLSILDIRAELEDGTAILIEMHLHGLKEIKAKTIRSWARVYGEDLEVGASYKSQPPAITIAFVNGAVETLQKSPDPDKIHRVCMITDYEDGTVFTDAMELHYINMASFAKAVNANNTISIDDNPEQMFVKWLSVITQQEISNKELIQTIYDDEEDIRMAVAVLAQQSEDKIIRQAYQRRKDEIYFNNKEKQDLETQLAEKDALIAELRLQLSKQ